MSVITAAMYSQGSSRPPRISKLLKLDNISRQLNLQVKSNGFSVSWDGVENMEEALPRLEKIVVWLADSFAFALIAFGFVVLREWIKENHNTCAMIIRAALRKGFFFTYAILVSLKGLRDIYATIWDGHSHLGTTDITLVTLIWVCIAISTALVVVNYIVDDLSPDLEKYLVNTSLSVAILANLFVVLALASLELL